MRDDELGAIMFGLSGGPLLQLHLSCSVSDSAEVIVLRVHLPGRTHADQMAAVAEYLVGAGWGLEVGSFDLDFRSGEIVYRAAIIVLDGVTSAKAVESVIDRSMGTVIRYAPGLLEVADGAKARDVLARIEGWDTEEG